MFSTPPRAAARRYHIAAPTHGDPPSRPWCPRGSSARGPEWPQRRTATEDAPPSPVIGRVGVGGVRAPLSARADPCSLRLSPPPRSRRVGRGPVQELPGHNAPLAIAVTHPEQCPQGSSARGPEWPQRRTATEDAPPSPVIGRVGAGGVRAPLSAPADPCSLPLNPPPRSRRVGRGPVQELPGHNAPLAIAVRHQEQCPRGSSARGPEWLQRRTATEDAPPSPVIGRVGVGGVRAPPFRAHRSVLAAAKCRSRKPECSPPSSAGAARR
jgi:hypothetical protein